MSKKAIRHIAIAGLAILAFISLVQGIRNAANFSQDFQWDAARALVDKVDPYELSLDFEADNITSEGLRSFYKLFKDAGVEQKMEANQFPSLLVLLIPYTFLPPLVARYAWIVSNILFTAGIIWLLRRTFLKSLPVYEFALCVLLMIAGTPYRNQLGVGQHTLFSFCFFLLAVWLDEVKPYGNRVGIIACLAISYFKYTLTAPLALYFIYKKRYVEFIASVITHIIATIVIAFLYGKSVIYMIVAPLKVSSALSAEGGLDIGALLGGGLLPLALGGVIACFLFVITLRLPKNCGYVLFPLLLTWSLIITYHRTYDFFVLSAAAGLFTSVFLELFGEKIYKIFKGYYYVVVMLIYFGLRIFNENTESKIVIGFMYYVLVIAITVLSCLYRNRIYRGNGYKDE